MTSTQLIPINQTKFDNQIKQTIDARDLHSFLESKQDFSTWIKNRLNDFEENIDYISLHKIMEREIGATKRIEYFLTIETAKHLSMLEKNDKGKEIRRYFIAKEKEANEKQIALPTTYKEALKSLILRNRNKKNYLKTPAEKKFKDLNKIHKVYALYKQGVGGEKENAKALLENLLEKSNITLEDYEQNWAKDVDRVKIVINRLREIYKYYKKSSFKRKLQFIFFVLHLLFIKNIKFTIKLIYRISKFFTLFFLVSFFLVSKTFYKQYFKK